MVLDQYNDVIYERFSGKTESRFIASIMGEKRIINENIKIKIGVEWIDWNNPGFNPTTPSYPGTNLSKLSFYFGISAQNNIEFN
jgi:hypothetical protein